MQKSIVIIFIICSLTFGILKCVDIILLQKTEIQRLKSKEDKWYKEQIEKYLPLPLNEKVKQPNLKLREKGAKG